MAFWNLLVVHPGVPTVPVHDEGHMLWNWPCSEDLKKDLLSSAGDLVPKPAPATMNEHMP